MKKRLKLKKVTLRDLDSPALGGVAGGTNPETDSLRFNGAAVCIICQDHEDP